MSEIDQKDRKSDFIHEVNELLKKYPDMFAVITVGDEEGLSCSSLYTEWPGVEKLMLLSMAPQFYTREDCERIDPQALKAFDEEWEAFHKASHSIVH